MSRLILTAAAMRAAEEAAVAGGTSVETLMERAGAAVAGVAWRFGGGRPALILCGPGNNGGDGYVAARVLSERGANVRVAATGEPRTEAAKAARARWGQAVEDIVSAEPATVLIDALFGVGLTRALDERLSTKLRSLVDAAHLSIAVDLPSGVSTDDGALLSAVPVFALTVALGALKPAHKLQPAARHCGRVLVSDIGVPVVSSWVDLARPELTAPAPRDHKYTRGMVAVVGGAMPGAAALAAIAAARSGAGYVVAIDVDAPLPAAIVRRSRAQLRDVLDHRHLRAIVLGPGLGRDAKSWETLDLVMSPDRAARIVADGDALWHLGETGFDRTRYPAIVTPHAGEFAHFFGDDGDKLSATRSAAGRTGMCIVYKGADTLIASADDRVCFAADATSWLSTAGTGDALAGIIGAMLARGLDPFDAACAGVWLHGEAARRSAPAFIADDLAVNLPGAIAACL